MYMTGFTGVPRARRRNPEACGCRKHGPLMAWMNRRVENDLVLRMAAGGVVETVRPFGAFRADSAFAGDPQVSAKPVIFTNLRLFDGLRSSLRDGMDVRVEHNRITDILPAGQGREGAAVVDCGGRVLMPGLIDAHWHSMLCGITQMAAMTADPAYIHLVAAREAQHTLMRGFTSVRDAGGPSFALKRAIDEGLVHGPRIYPSGAMVSQTSGHGDFRMPYEVPSRPDALSHFELAGVSAIADGHDEVLRRAREQLMLGASQLKLMAGGGVTSLYDPLTSVQFTEEELRAGVQAAADWGTYVMVHVYSSQGIQRALKAGVRSIEHGQLADEETARMMADHGAWWSLQPFFGDEDANPHPDPVSHAKQQQVAQGTERAYALSRQFDIKTAWGTDILFSPQLLARHSHMLAKLTRLYAPLDLLRMATGANGELLGMSGLRNPYAGAVGTITPGALADLLVVDGDPSRDLDFLTEPQRNLRLIMKDGRVYKNSL
ncbi:metal-dependent hydrolase family protein [Bordetella avium]|uniref:metal-dependent hydrolase family protein n=1 Tax=Bordetella avium TaxID=521 RepID=UPI000FD70036|nr:hydrolase [Bordetella avium]